MNGNYQETEVRLWLGMAICSQGIAWKTQRESTHQRYMNEVEESLWKSWTPPLGNSREPLTLFIFLLTDDKYFTSPYQWGKEIFEPSQALSSLSPDSAFHQEGLFLDILHLTVSFTSVNLCSNLFHGISLLIFLSSPLFQNLYYFTFSSILWVSSGTVTLLGSSSLYPRASLLSVG